jgi:hypothetical protein
MPILHASYLAFLPSYFVFLSSPNREIRGI